MPTVFTFIAAMSITALALYLVLRTPISRWFADSPNKAQAMHVLPTPRIGGAVLWPVVVLAGAFFSTPAAGAASTSIVAGVASAAVLFVVSVIDDTRSISVRTRFLAQACVTVACSFTWAQAVTQSLSDTGLVLHVGLVATVLILTLLWATNLYNFMDGANGMAGLMGMIGFGAYTAACWLAGGEVVMAESALEPRAAANALLPWVTAISGACAGFLTLNLPQARAFMGDAGSIPMGFLAALVGVAGYVNGLWSLFFPLMVFSPFFVDATYTLVKRLLRGESPIKPHREHIYQQLITTLGWSHLKVAVVYGASMLVSAALALMMLAQPARTSGFSSEPLEWLAGWVVTYAVLLALAEWRFTLRRQRKTNPLAKEDQEAR
jgi:UDP-N-acetylmuramyl pentapeptide phosphotransferase/UDP-N-acetylglucosamine-1-phosphate transferase